MEPETVICTYPVKKNCEKEFETLLEKHGPTLRRLGLILDEPPQIMKRVEEGETTYVEIFTWKDDKATEEAHHIPEVQSIWEPMGRYVREVDGRPSWSFRHYRRLTPPYKAQ